MAKRRKAPKSQRTLLSKCLTGSSLPSLQSKPTWRALGGDRVTIYPLYYGRSSGRDNVGIMCPQYPSQGTTEPTSKPQRAATDPFYPSPASQEHRKRRMPYFMVLQVAIRVRYEAAKEGLLQSNLPSVSLLTSSSNMLVSTRSAKASPSPLLQPPHWPSHGPRRAVLYALVLDRGAPEGFHSGHERINPRTRSLSSYRAELSV